jgi:glutamate formiminotransferase
LAKLVQCVPNFSEGRRPEVVERIVEAITNASAVQVVDHSMDVDHNRSVVTFIGSPEDIRKSVLAGARTAVELIDINKHKGAHPRVGAIDVIPIVPLHEMSMNEAISLSYTIGKDIADELRIPVYFYERSAVMRHRTNLAVIRKGGYESLKARGLVDGREPDLGPPELHPTAGVTVVGARGPLIAYNVNLATDDMRAARAIAERIRKLRDSGKGMAGVKAIAVHLKSRNIAQVSTNITQPNQTNVWDVYYFIEREAREMGVEVLESELIGAIREEAVLDSLRSATKLQGLSETRVLDHWMRRF